VDIADFAARGVHDRPLIVASGEFHSDATCDGDSVVTAHLDGVVPWLVEDHGVAVGREHV